MRSTASAPRPATKPRPARRPCQRRRALQRGDKCPACGRKGLDFNGWVQLACPHCGHIADSGSFT